MSQNYQQHGGNPYGQAEAGYGQSNPYGGTTYGQSNPYGGAPNEPLNAPPGLHQADSNYSQPSQYSQAGGLSAPPTNSAPQQHGSSPMTQSDFLARIDGTKQRIGQLTSDIQSISTIHQRMLASPDNSESAQLESIITQTQIRNTQIKDEIKFLEKDALRDTNSRLKKTQIESLKKSFRGQLEEFEKEESDYRKRYREAIGRQYRIINPDATEAEVREASEADWGNEGIFTQALKTNRSGQASSVLGAVRARHNDIERITRTMAELATLFQQLDEQVVLQEVAVTQVEQGAIQVNDETTKANVELTHGIKSARNARKWKWWLLFVVFLIILIVGLAVGLYFGVGPGKSKKLSGN